MTLQYSVAVRNAGLDARETAVGASPTLELRTGVPDGEVYPRDFNAGDEVTGGLAVVAVREKWAATDSLDHDGSKGVSTPRRKRKSGE